MAIKVVATTTLIRIIGRRGVNRLTRATPMPVATPLATPIPSLP